MGQAVPHTHSPTFLKPFPGSDGQVNTTICGLCFFHPVVSSCGEEPEAYSTEKKVIQQKSDKLPIYLLFR